MDRYQWEFGVLTQAGFKEVQGLSNADTMQMEFNCLHCHKENTVRTEYEPVPLHQESLIHAFALEIQCDCGAVHKLDEAGMNYEIAEMREVNNPLQTTLF